jgi:Transglycosylase SLT domain
MGDVTPELLSSLEQQYNLPPGILAATAAVESSSGANAVRSPKGALGMFQLEPDTAAKYKVDPNDPASAASGAAQVWRDNLAASKGDIDQAAIHYIGGYDKSRWGKDTYAYPGKLLAALQHPQGAPAPASGSSSDPYEAAFAPPPGAGAPAQKGGAQDPYEAAFVDATGAPDGSASSRPQDSGDNSGAQVGVPVPAGAGGAVPAQGAAGQAAGGSGGGGSSSGEGPTLSDLITGQRRASYASIPGDLLKGTIQGLDVIPNDASDLLDWTAKKLGISPDTLARAHSYMSGGPSLLGAINAYGNSAIANPDVGSGAKFAGEMAATLPVTEIKPLQAFGAEGKIASALARVGDLSLQGAGIGALNSRGDNIGTNAAWGAATAPVLGVALDKFLPPVLAGAEKVISPIRSVTDRVIAGLRNEAGLGDVGAEAAPGAAGDAAGDAGAGDASAAGAGPQVAPAAANDTGPKTAPPFVRGAPAEAAPAGAAGGGGVDLTGFPPGTTIRDGGAYDANGNLLGLVGEVTGEGPIKMPPKAPPEAPAAAPADATAGAAPDATAESPQAAPASTATGAPPSVTPEELAAAIGSKSARSGLAATRDLPPDVAANFEQLKAQGVPAGEALREADVVGVGAQPTVGVVKRSPADMGAMFEGAKQPTDEGRALSQMIAGNNAAVHDTVQGMIEENGGRIEPGTAMEGAAQSLAKASDAEKAGVNAAYKAADNEAAGIKGQGDAANAAAQTQWESDMAAHEAQKARLRTLNLGGAADTLVPPPRPGGIAAPGYIDLPNLRAALESPELANPTIEGGKALKSGVQGLMNAYSEGTGSVNLQQAERLRQAMNDAYDPLGGGINNHVGDLKAALDRDLDAADAGPAYKQARALHKAWAEQYDDPEGVANLIRRDAKGNFVNAENWRVQDRDIFSTGDARFNQIVRQLQKNGDQAALSRLKAAVIQRASNAASNTAADELGNAKFIAKNWFNELDKINLKKLEVLFSPEEIAQLAHVGRAAVHLNEVIPGSTNPSGTASKILAALNDVKSPPKASRVARVLGNTVRVGAHAAAHTIPFGIGNIGVETATKGAQKAAAARSAARAAEDLAAALTEQMDPAGARTAEAAQTAADAAAKRHARIARLLSERSAPAAGERTH